MPEKAFTDGNSRYCHAERTCNQGKASQFLAMMATMPSYFVDMSQKYKRENWRSGKRLEDAYPKIILCAGSFRCSLLKSAVRTSSSGGHENLEQHLSIRRALYMYMA